jgi:hypothetical protein
MNMLVPPLRLHLFGASTPTGAAFLQQASMRLQGCTVAAYSRQPYSGPNNLHWADLTDPASFFPAGQSDDPGLWICFAPIWLLAPFLEHLAIHYPYRLRGLRAFIACSSSSVLTKRFTANRFDRHLVKRLVDSEQQLLATCARLQVKCLILRPTLIYGTVGPYVDQNLSRLIALLRRLPLLPLPAETGLRQPIHATQLASVALQIATHLIVNNFKSCFPDCIELGGDTELSYSAMLLALQRSLPYDDPARQCYLLPVPNRLFFFCAAPLLILSPKCFEAVLRTAADLSGFTHAHQFVGEPPQSFPAQPLTR